MVVTWYLLHIEYVQYRSKYSIFITFHVISCHVGTQMAHPNGVVETASVYTCKKHAEEPEMLLDDDTNETQYSHM